MDAKKFLRQAAYAKIEEKPIERVTVREILTAADVSKQTFYRYYRDKYELANEIYYELTQKNILQPEAVETLTDWKNTYKKQFHAFREHLDFIRHLYTSRETGCTTDFEIAATIRFDKQLLARRGADLGDPRILFAIEAKDVGGTYMMRDWILAGMQVADEEMVTRFQQILPQILVPYYT